jgi:hypothetical protein
MKALSVRAPWWWLILHAGKDIENRDWATRFRGTVYLHAGKWFRGEEVYHDWMYGLGLAPSVMVPSGMVLSDLQKSCGCIVGKVDIVDCVSRSVSPWFFGEYGFLLRNPVAFERPIPFKGALGFFDVPSDLESLDLQPATSDVDKAKLSLWGER